MSRPRVRTARARARGVVGWLALAAGAALVAQAAAVRVRGEAWQELHRRALEPPSGTPVAAPAGRAVARLRLARLGIDTVVTEGTDPESLGLGPGHMPGTALPGEPDNCIIAGHRDGPFGRLPAARPGDVVELRGRSGPSRYRVRDVEVVDEDDRRPLAPSSQARLTLITCYPIHHLGPAPRRLVIRGELIGQARAAS